MALRSTRPLWGHRHRRPRPLRGPPRPGARRRRRPRRPRPRIRGRRFRRREGGWREGCGARGDGLRCRGGAARRQRAAHPAGAAARAAGERGGERPRERRGAAFGLARFSAAERDRQGARGAQGALREDHRGRRRLLHQRLAGADSRPSSAPGARGPGLRAGARTGVDGPPGGRARDGGRLDPGPAALWRGAIACTSWPLRRLGGQPRLHRGARPGRRCLKHLLTACRGTAGPE
mmetsp:Transcript_15463/g.54174  ORF Transcript_15463/g.54174 Transcript_15463/m.54174 type:complete len:234 (+) Transcript_15463:701-1402(+)